MSPFSTPIDSIEALTKKETLESFLANQMTKPYLSSYEKLILDLKVERTPQLLKAVGSWTRQE